MTIKIKAKHLRGISKVIGLINKKSYAPIYFKTRFGIHTFGLKFPIDVLVLDRGGHVVKVVQGLRPNRIFIWNPRYDRLVELSEGTIKKRKITVGSKIDLSSL